MHSVFRRAALRHVAPLALGCWAWAAAADQGVHADVAATGVVPAGDVAPADGVGRYRLLLPATPRVERLDAHRAWRDWLVEHGFATSRCGHLVGAGEIELDVITPGQVDALVAAGFSVIDYASVGPLDPAADGAVMRTDSAYFDPDEIETMLTQTALDHPDITSLFQIGTSYEGQPILALEISNHPGVPEDEPAVLFNGQHHAREVATSHIVMDVVQKLTDGYAFGQDQELIGWVNGFKTVCVPMVNPDGTRYVFDVNGSWRKNRRDYGGSCVGVDLNRNYPYLWGPGCGSSGTCTSILYRGPSAGSENETTAMMALQDAYHFVMATSYHSFGRFIDYPYACGDGSPSSLMPEHDVVDAMMNGLADAIFSYGGISRYDVFSPVPFGGVNGDDTSWYYAHEGVYSFIVEVGTSFEPPVSQLADIVGRNREGWKYLYRRLEEARIDVHVTDACSQLPLEAEVTLTDFAFDTGELPRVTFAPFGRWTFLALPGASYTVRASAAGFVATEATVTVLDEPVQVDLALARMDPPPRLFGDVDCDGVLTAADFAALAACMGGPQIAVEGGCVRLDEGDGDVDLEDVAALQRVVEP